MNGSDLLKATGIALLKGTTWTATQIVKGTVKSVVYVHEHREEINKAAKMTAIATVETVKSAGRMLNDTASIKIYSDKKIDALRMQIEAQGQQYRDLINERQKNHRSIDTIAVGGDLLKDILNKGASPEVEAAFAAAYPNEAQEISFEDAVRNTPDDHLNGWIAGVKGKLFEMKYVDYLNEGNLPDGYTAILAQSATQPGWDISVLNKNGQIDELLQMKATNSVEYVQNAMERYPDIDVVTTDEVYSQLVMNGAADHVMNAGISNADLTNHVIESIDGSAIDMHWTPPIISLALIAFTTYRHDELTDKEKMKFFGERSGKSYISYLVGGSVAAITQTWWLGLVAGIGTRYCAVKGSQKRDVYHKLEQIVHTNDKLLISVDY